MLKRTFLLWMALAWCIGSMRAWSQTTPVWSGAIPDGEVTWNFNIIPAEDDYSVVLRSSDGARVKIGGFAFRAIASQVSQIAAPAEPMTLGTGVESGRLRVYVSREFPVPGAVLLLSVMLLGGATWVVRRRASALRQTNQSLVESRVAVQIGQERERARIARDLHDGPVQDLHAVLLTSKSGSLPEAVFTQVGLVIREVRSIADDLRPPALDPFGLARALEAHAERIGRRYPSVALCFETSGTDAHLHSTTSLLTFRIAQESITNAVRHGHPAHVDILLHLDGDLHLTVRDDGVGIQPDAALRPRHDGGLGMVGMRERADILGGRLVIRSGDPSGTVVELSVPRHLAETPQRPPDLCP